MEPEEPKNPPKPDEPTQSPIMSEAEAQRRPVFDPTGRVEQITADEIKVADTRRHPFGLIVVYLQVIIALLLSFGLILFLLPGVLTSLGLSSSGAEGLAVLSAMFVVLLAILFLFLATRIYWANQLIITNENITHVTQISLFHRNVSEISMENVEDVTALQEGIFPTIFNFGRLHIETAGEQDNYDFLYCPNPSAYAKAVQDARLEFIKRHS